MASTANDGTLVRGSISITIAGVTYVLLDYKRSAKARSETDYDTDGKPAGASHVEDFEMISGTIRARSDQAVPPKFTSFSFDSMNWYIKDREEVGSTQGLKSYAVEIMEQIGETITVS